MRWHYLGSSFISSAAYRYNRRELHVVLFGREAKLTEYSYFNVPRSRFDGLRHASSPGAYFNAHIANSYSYTTRTG